VDTVQALLAAGAGVNSAAADGTTPLHAASEGGHMAVVQALIAAGGDVSSRRPGWGPATALMAAAVRGRLEVVQLLRGAGATVKGDRSWEGYLEAAAEHGDVATVEALVAAGVDVSEQWRGDDHDPVWLAARGGHAAIVKLLVDAGASVDHLDMDNWTTPLVVAAECGHVEIVKLLLAAGAEVETPPREAPVIWLHGRFIGDDSAKIGPYTKRDPSTSALRIAAENGHLAVVEALLAAGADVNEVDDERVATPLRIAAEHGHAGVVRALLAAGADANEERSDKDPSVLTVAAGRGHVDVVQALRRGH